MPTYEYECRACGYRFEKFQPITANPIRTCPKCKRRKVRRLIGSGAGILFKGSGFYETDYRSESYRKAAEKEKAAKSGDSDPDKGKTKKDTKTKKEKPQAGKSNNADQTG